MTQRHLSSRDRRTRYRQTIGHLETLEPRTLLSAAISTYPLPGVIVGFGAYDSSGALWIYDGSSGNLERLAHGAVDTSAGSVIPLSFVPRALAGGLNGQIYAADSYGIDGSGAIDDINTLTGNVTPTNLANSAESPVALTVTGDGAVWFVGQGALTINGTQSSQTNLIGRVGTDGSLTTFTTGASLSDSQASLIAANGANSVWIAMGGVDVDGEPLGTNRVAAASWSSGAIALTAYDVNTGTNADTNGLINGLVSDPDGSVWFTLSNNPADFAPCKDTIVHLNVDTSGGTPVVTQKAFTDPSQTTPQNYYNLAEDAGGHIWFSATLGNQFGVLDPDPSITGNPFTTYPNPTSAQFDTIVANAGGTQISFLNGPDDNGDSAVIQIDVTAAVVPPTVTLSGPATANEGDTQSYTFTASEPGTTTYSIQATSGGTPLTVKNAQFDPATGVGSFDVTFSYAGTSTVSVQVQDSGGLVSNVATIPVAVAVVPPTVTLSGPATANAGDTKHYTFTSSDPGTVTYSILASSGGAVGTVSNATINPATGAGSFDVTFSDAATSTVSVQVRDSDGAVSNVSAIDVAVAVVFSGAANNVNIREATFLNNVLLATFTAPTPKTGYTATISWGDNTTTVVTPTLVPGSTDTYAIIVSGKAFATQGTYNGVITVTDGSTPAGTLTFTSTIGDIPLNVTSLTASPLLLRIVTAVGTFTDDGNLALSTWKATINWGDGTSSTGLIVRNPAQPGQYFVLAIHQYRARGTYSVQMTVTTSEVNAAVTNSTLTTTVTAR